MSADILVLDHQRSGSDAIKSFLSPHGYQVTIVHTIIEAAQKINQKPFDIVLAKPSITHLEYKEITSLLQNVRSNSFFMGLIEQPNALQRVEALEAGADDCLSLPYHPQELLLRLQKLIQRRHATRSELLVTKQFTLNIKSGDLECPWGKILLRKKEFLILSLLFQQKNQIVSKEKLIERVWGIEETPLISTIDVHVRRIRLKIKDKHKKIIRTSYGVGYMFCDM